MLIKGFRGVVLGQAGPASGENRRRGVETAGVDDPFPSGRRWGWG